MRYEVWKAATSDGETIGMVPEGRIKEQVAQGLWEGELSQLDAFEASTFDEACQKYYDVMGWGTYRPMED